MIYRGCGSGMSTIKEIAKACNVSIATVSNILNNKPGASKATRDYVLQKAKELNYTPNYVAKNLKSKNTRTIGVIAEDMTIFSIPDIIDGITKHCEEENYQILLMNLRLYQKFYDTYYHKRDYYGRVHEVIKDLMAKQVNGIIYVAAHERTIKCIPEDLSIPAVMAYGYTDNDQIPSIIVDDVHGAYKIVNYMIEKGHQRIGVITGKNDSMHMQDRLRGYQKALYDNKILYDPSIVCYGDWIRESGHEFTDKLLDKGVTAVFCMNDLIAGGVYDRISERGFTPGEDISIAGFDNRQLSSYYKPPLTTINLPLHDIGYCASEVIIKMIQSEDGRDILPLYQRDCELLIRDSVKDIN